MYWLLMKIDFDLLVVLLWWIPKFLNSWSFEMELFTLLIIKVHHKLIHYSGMYLWPRLPVWVSKIVWWIFLHFQTCIYILIWINSKCIGGEVYVGFQTSIFRYMIIEMWILNNKKPIFRLLFQHLKTISSTTLAIELYFLIVLQIKFIVQNFLHTSLGIQSCVPPSPPFT